MEQGWDPDVKKYFRKILNTVFFGLLWMTGCATAGIYYQLGYRTDKPFIYTILFYAGMVISLMLLLRWFYLTWKK
jgi:hypothetical protein